MHKTDKNTIRFYHSESTLFSVYHWKASLHNSTIWLTFVGVESCWSIKGGTLYVEESSDGPYLFPLLSSVLDSLRHTSIILGHLYNISVKHTSLRWTRYMVLIGFTVSLLHVLEEQLNQSLSSSIAPGHPGSSLAKFLARYHHFSVVGVAIVLPFGFGSLRRHNPMIIC
ncbi:hypothetical protein ABKN59_002999 [Abortiporus biennis]